MKTIKLSQSEGKFAVVDDDDYEALAQWTWAYHKRGYAYRGTTINGKPKKFFMHRELLQAPNGSDIDHINGNKLDNQKANLRVCTRSQNMANMHKSSGTSKYKGVNWDKSRGKWQSRIMVNYKGIALGRFDIEADAAQAYNVAALHYFGSFAVLNQIGDI